MVEYDNKSLKNGHCDLPRSVFALSDAAIRDARFLLREGAKSYRPDIYKKWCQMLALDAASK